MPNPESRILNPESSLVALALGSNLGDRLGRLRAAVAAIGSLMPVSGYSAVYETAAVYVTDQPDFLNAVIVGTTGLPPLTLLWSLRQIEVELGREPSFRYGPRVIDIDILFYGDQIYHDAELTLPHARLAEREFVLRPLADLVPDWRHPATGLSVAQMLARLPEFAARRLSEGLLP